jgi:hypothetical protein
MEASVKSWTQHPWSAAWEDDQEALRCQTVDGDGVVGVREHRDGVTGNLDGAKQRTPEQEVVVVRCHTLKFPISGCK